MRTFFSGVLAPAASSARALALSCFRLILAATLARSLFASPEEEAKIAWLPSPPTARGASSTAALGALPLDRDLAGSVDGYRTVGAGSIDGCLTVVAMEADRLLGPADGCLTVVAKDTDLLLLGSSAGAADPPRERVLAEEGRAGSTAGFLSTDLPLDAGAGILLGAGISAAAPGAAAEPEACSA